MLKADAEGPGWSDAEIAEAFGCHAQTVYNVRRRFVEKGFSEALGRSERQEPPCPRKLDGAGEARLIALSCGQPPAGSQRWTLRVLADKLVALEIVESISPETVRPDAKKNALKPHLRESWVIPPGEDAAFVASMEHVLDYYQRPLETQFPVVNMDEQSVQLKADLREGHPMKPGQVEPCRFRV